MEEKIRLAMSGKRRTEAEQVPGLAEEKRCAREGYRLVAGVDEVGRGCLAGPVVAAAVIMPFGRRSAWYKEVRDSKLLTPEKREYLSPLIHEAAVSIGTGVVDSGLIDRLGMTQAVQTAMKIAVEKLHPRPDYVLIDYMTVKDLPCPQKGVREGDTLCFSIACASIVAKVFRDHLMADLDRKYPGYGLSMHKGYGTENHLACLRKLGPSPVHRRLFKPVKNIAQLAFDDIRVNTSLTDYGPKK